MYAVCLVAPITWDLASPTRKEPVSPALAGRFLATGHQGIPWNLFDKCTDPLHEASTLISLSDFQSNAVILGVRISAYKSG